MCNQKTKSNFKARECLRSSTATMLEIDTKEKNFTTRALTSWYTKSATQIETRLAGHWSTLIMSSCYNNDHRSDELARGRSTMSTSELARMMRQFFCSRSYEEMGICCNSGTTLDQILHNFKGSTADRHKEREREREREIECVCVSVLGSSESTTRDLILGDLEQYYEE